jgi:hypothetical protein
MLPVTLLWADGLWFSLAQGDAVTALLGAVALVLTAIPGIGWLSHTRAARRFNAALDVYAAREIDRTRRGNGPRRVRWTPRRDEEPFPTRADVVGPAAARSDEG